MTNTTITRDGTPIGWIRVGGCSHPKCRHAIKNGLLFHATPRVGTLPSYHFATFAQAAFAIDEQYDNNVEGR